MVDIMLKNKFQMLKLALDYAGPQYTSNYPVDTQYTSNYPAVDNQYQEQKKNGWRRPVKWGLGAATLGGLGYGGYRMHGWLNDLDRTLKRTQPGYKDLKSTFTDIGRDTSTFRKSWEGAKDTADAIRKFYFNKIKLLQ
jgi:hypothetical protein